MLRTVPSEDRHVAHLALQSRDRILLMACKDGKLVDEELARALEKLGIHVLSCRKFLQLVLAQS